MKLVCVWLCAGGSRRKTDRAENESRVLFSCRRGCARVDVRHHVAAHRVGKDRTDQHRRCGTGIDVALDEAVLMKSPEVGLEGRRRTHRTTIGGSAQLGVFLALAHAASHERSGGTDVGAEGSRPFLQLALRIDRHFREFD